MKKVFFSLIVLSLFVLMTGITGCDKKTDNPVAPDNNTQLLTATPNPVSVTVGSNTQSAISGGAAPYSIQTQPDATIATATIISSGTLTIIGLKAGSTSLVVSDGATPSKTVTVSITVSTTGNTLTATPNPVTVIVGSNTQSAISGGAAPYSIQTAPDATIATATITSSGSLSITGVKAGSTLLVVKDGATPSKTVTVSITVSTSGGGGGFTTAGTLSFSSDKGAFSANGIYNESATSGQAVGSFYTSSGGVLQIVAYKFVTGTTFDYVAMTLTKPNGIATGQYSFTPTGTQYGSFVYFPGLNPLDSTSYGNGYMLMSGSANLSTFSTSSAAGTFSGTGFYVSNAVPDMSKTITITGGTFNTPYISGGSATYDIVTLSVMQRLRNRLK